MSCTCLECLHYFRERVVKNVKCCLSSTNNHHFFKKERISASCLLSGEIISFRKSIGNIFVVVLMFFPPDNKTVGKKVQLKQESNTIYCLLSVIYEKF